MILGRAVSCLYFVLLVTQDQTDIMQVAQDNADARVTLLKKLFLAEIMCLLTVCKQVMEF